MGWTQSPKTGETKLTDSSALYHSNGLGFCRPKFLPPEGPDLFCLKYSEKIPPNCNCAAAKDGCSDAFHPPKLLQHTP